MDCVSASVPFQPSEAAVEFDRFDHLNHDFVVEIFNLCFLLTESFFSVA